MINIKDNERENMKKQTKQQIVELSNKPKDKYKFKNGEEVIYVGSLFDKYKNITGVVQRRKRKKSINFCEVWFEDIQTTTEFHEKFLKNKKEHLEENMRKNKEVENENS